MSLQTQYPNAIWYDSNYSGTESGSFAQPYTSINTAFNASTDSSAVIIAKAGVHTFESGQSFTYSSYSGGVTLIGDGDVTFESGEALNAYAFLYNAPSDTTYTFKNLKIVNNSTGSYGQDRSFIGHGNASMQKLVVDSCSYVSNDTSTQRSVFSAQIIEIKSCQMECYVTGGSQFFNAGTSLLINTCTLLHDKNNSTPAAQVAGLQTLVLKNITTTVKNSIIYSTFANSNNVTTGLTGNATANKTFTNSLIYSTASTDYFGDFTVSLDSNGASFKENPLFVDVANNDFRLRPSSPCINAGTAS